MRVGRELLPCLNVNVQLFLPPFLQESCYVKSIKLSGLWQGFEVCFLLALGPHLCGGASRCVSLLKSLAWPPPASSPFCKQAGNTVWPLPCHHILPPGASAVPGPARGGEIRLLGYGNGASSRVAIYYLGVLP